MKKENNLSLIIIGVLIIIAVSALLVYFLGNQKPEADSPKNIVASFYDTWVAHEGNPLVDGVYRTSPLTTEQFADTVDELLESFDGGSYDPVLCAQDIPQDITVDNETIVDSKASVIVTEQFSSSEQKVKVELEHVDGLWKIQNISCNEGDDRESINDGTSPVTQELVDEYIRDNITTLSSEEPVLGGSWHVTSVRFVGPHTAIVEYEDGHIALVAEVAFTVFEAGEVTIESFEVLSDDRAERLHMSDFDEIGNIVLTENDSWRLVYEKPGKPALTTVLVFDEYSVCTDTRKNGSCFPAYWEEGDRAEVVGIKQDGEVLVSHLRIVGEASKSISGGGTVNSFESCVDAGYEVLYPDCVGCEPYCETPESQKFFASSNRPEICVDKCGDGICQEVVCLGSGCPCAETPSSCPADCASTE